MIEGALRRLSIIPMFNEDGVDTVTGFSDWKEHMKIVYTLTMQGYLGCALSEQRL